MNVQIPKAENIISSNYFVDCFVEYVRANNYPHFDHTLLVFEGGGDMTAMCSEWVKDDHPITLKHMELVLNGTIESDTHVSSFEGGMYEVSGQMFVVLVDEHLYFFNF